MKKKAKKPDPSVGTVVDAEIKEVKREWRNLLKFTDENKILFAAFLVVMTALVVINTIYIVVRTNDNADSTVSTVQANPNLILTSLQTGTNNVIQAKVSNVTENSKTDYAFPIDANSTMLILDIEITNRTQQLQKLIPVNQLFVRSDEGDYSPMHASMYVTNPLPSTDLQPGQTIKGEISFEVPKRVASPILYVDTGWNGYAPLLFDVLH